MKIFIKPSGVEVIVNEGSESHALSLGWKPKESAQEPVIEQVVEQVSKKRGRPRKDS